MNGLAWHYMDQAARRLLPISERYRTDVVAAIGFYIKPMYREQSGRYMVGLLLNTRVFYKD